MRQSLYARILSKNRKSVIFSYIFSTVAVCQGGKKTIDIISIIFHSGYYAKMANYFKKFEAKIDIRERAI